MSFATSLTRLRAAVAPDHRGRSADGNRTTVQVADLAQLLADWERLDRYVRIRS